MAVEWLWSRIDRGLGAVTVAAGAVLGSQIAPLIAQYLARTGDRIAKAQAQVLAIQSSLKFQVMSETVRGELANDAARELSAGRAIHDPIAAANLFTKPFSLWRNGDVSTVDLTVASFVPALPTTPEAITYTVVGVALGFLAYEILRWPVMIVLTGPPKRRFRRKG